MSFHELFRPQQKVGPVVRPAKTASRAGQLARKPRHSGIFEAVHALDTQLDEATRQSVAGWLGAQYAAEYGSVPLGFVAVCYLGPPYVDHRLDLIGGTVDHFAADNPMPPPYDSARMLARSGSYAFVEVYSDGRIVPVADDGSIS